jgi:hypothetical protein
VLLRPKFDSEDDAHDAIDLIGTCGQDLDPFQVTLTLITLASTGGRLSASEVGALIARQNGKGGWLEAVAIWSLFEVYLYGERDGLTGAKNTTLWTAHELKTSDEAYARVKSLIEANPDLAAEVVTWNGGLTGTHIIQLRDGSRLIFLARSKSSGRGFSPRRIIFDEAQELSALAFRAMMYATSAQGARRQLIFAGTVPSEENDSAIFTGVRDRGRSGKIARLAWAEWTPEGSENPLTPPDPTSWKARAEANPALGSRILASTIDEEWDAAQADLEGFMRERLSVWPDSGRGAYAALPEWAALVADAPTLVNGALGVACDVEETRVVACWAEAGEPGYLGINDARRWTDRAAFAAHVADIQRRRNCEVIVRAKSTLIDALENAGVRLTLADRDMRIQAASDLALAVQRGEITHGDYPELNAAVAAAKWKTTEGRRQLVDLRGDLEAVMLAHHCIDSLDYDIADSFG